MNLSRYRKAIVAVVGAAAVAVTAALTDGSIDPSEVGGIIVAILTALGVYSIPNNPPANPAERWVGERISS
jgi:peptidoglycan/LPS O-acetylase OafA/YrhL